VAEALRFTLALLPNALRNRRFEVIDGNQFPFLPLFPSRLMAARNRCPLVATWHEVWEEYWTEYLGGRTRGAVGRKIEELSVRLPDRVIAVSGKTGRGLIEGLGLPPGRVSVVPSGVDLDLIASLEGEAEEAKIVYAGRLLPHKNVDALLRAMVGVVREVPGARLTIVGDGPMRGEWTRLSRKLGLGGSVEWKGFLDYPSVLEEIRSAALLVLPSSREGSGMVMLEAMAAKTPVLAVRSERSAAAELLADGRGALCDPPELEETILRLLGDEDGRRRLIRRGWEYAKEREYGRVAGEVLKVYQQAIAEGGKGKE
jgi:glycosyltransferase involved in cell wall biosynthesis